MTRAIRPKRVKKDSDPPSAQSNSGREMATEVKRIRQSLVELENQIAELPSSELSLDESSIRSPSGRFGSGLPACLVTPWPSSSPLRLGTSHWTSLLHQPSPGPSPIATMYPEYQADKLLMTRLPPIDVIDPMLEFYFENCVWATCGAHASTFLSSWAEYKSGERPHHVIFVTLCEILAIAARHLPSSHSLIAELAPSNLELSKRCHETAVMADSDRRLVHPSFYDVELVECLLVRYHYAQMSGVDHEGLWAIICTATKVAMSLGLHEDPGESMDIATAERRRWAWWNVIGRESTQMPNSGHLDGSKNLIIFMHVTMLRLECSIGELYARLSSRRNPSAGEFAQLSVLRSWEDGLPDEFKISYNALIQGLSYPDMNSLAIRSTSPREVGDKRCPYLLAATAAADELISFVASIPEGIINDPSLVLDCIFHNAPFQLLGASAFLAFLDTTSTSFQTRQRIERAIRTVERLHRWPSADDTLQALRLLRGVHAVQGRGQKQAGAVQALKALVFGGDPPLASAFATPPLTPQMPAHVPNVYAPFGISGEVGSDVLAADAFLANSFPAFPSSISLPALDGPVQAQAGTPIDLGDVDVLESMFPTTECADAQHAGKAGPASEDEPKAMGSLLEVGRYSWEKCSIDDLDGFLDSLG
ncbi:hypothetical protein K488DRAFT_70982 [Vararia minispora EC-137]|uniref:Uncharacterized protein n=1 Tax=Vararia minispora EC-137 TaxID=1314806 RepID=A0ACB8QJW9_9AGAM|nr:hypothetical protein K488DRAFT_70982 [Vararia minispora EC-137]